MKSHNTCADPALTPSAFPCHEDRIAEKVLEECENLKLTVPDQVAVLSCGDDPLFSAMGHSGLSSIVFPSEAIGRSSARLLHQWLEGDRPARAVHRVPPTELHVRQSSDPAASSDPIIARAVSFIRQHMAESPSVSDVARAAGISRRGLETRFRDKLHQTIREQILEVRIQAATALVRSTNHSMERIAEACGFSSGATFSRAYRAATGIAPSSQRK